MSVVYDRTAVVTGVSSGIGRGICKYLVDRGYTVFGSVRAAVTGDQLAAQLGVGFYPLVFDVCDREAIRDGFERVSEYLGARPLSALVNNAGLAQFGPLELVDDLEFEDVVAVSVLGTRNVTNAFLPLLRSDPRHTMKPGKIVNISSLSGIVNTPMNGPYCIAKHALESLSEIYRRELLADRIDVVAIRSGPIQSQIWAKNVRTAPMYEHPTYDAMSQTAQSIMQHAQATALPAEVIAKLVWEIIEGRRRRTAYHVGKGALFAQVLSSPLFPKRLADWLIHQKLTRRTT